jgi:hypothetical protein
MDADLSHRRQTEALIEQIWGQKPTEAADEIDPDTRAFQNQALALAIKSYLQSYIDDLAEPRAT